MYQLDWILSTAYSCFMHQSIPAVKIPRTTPGIRTTFSVRPPGIPLNSFARGLDQIKFFPKLVTIYSVFLLSVSVFKRLLRTARKMLVVFHNSEVTKSHPKGDDDIKFSID